MEEVGDEHLAADVHVDADQLDGRRVLGAGATARPASPAATPKPNFESSWPVRTNSWVWASTPGVTRTSTFGRSPSSAWSAARRSSSSKLSTTMRPTPASQRRAQLVERLVVAVQHEAVGGDAGGEGDVQLAAGGDVEVHALLVGEAGHGQAQERLGGVGDAVAEGGDRLAAAGPQVGLVVDEQRRAVLARPGRATSQPPMRQAPVVADRGGVGQQVARQRPGHRPAYIASGARHAEQVEADGEADAGRLDQPQAGLGELGRHVTEHVAVVVEAVERGRPARAPRW